MALIVTGCAETGFPEAARQRIEQSGAGEGNLHRVRSIPTLRLDTQLLTELEHAAEDQDAASARDRAVDVLAAARRLGDAALKREVARLSHAQLADLWRRHLAADDPPADLRVTVYERLVEVSRPRENEWTSRIDHASTGASLRRVLREFLALVEPLPVDAGRSGRAAMFALANYAEPDADDLQRAHSAFRYPDRPVWYEPDIGSAHRFVRRAEGDISRAELLLKLSPTIVQERLRLPPYDAAVDQIGAVRFVGEDNTPAISVDVNQPAVYAFTQEALIHGEPRTQLVYVYWYPAYPELGVRSAFVGPFDGLTLRITLDRENRPAIYETIRNCGDEHRIWISTHIETEAGAHFGATLFGAAFAIERPGSGAAWRVAGLVDTPVRPDAGPIMHVQAATHRPADLTYDRSALVATSREAPPMRYQLYPYELLEGVEPGSPRMFDSAGLVIGAVRPSGRLRAASGALSPGRPRQRGTLRFENGDRFDDPLLLERRLRLPPGF